MTSRALLAKLHDAIGQLQVVRIERKPKYSDRVDGFVLAVGKKWALVAQVADGGYFNGYIAFRVGDVKRISRDESLATEFARTQPEWPPAYLAEVDLASTGGVIQALGRDGDLVAIQKENERSGMWIGRLDELQDRLVYLHEVWPDATWHPEPLGYSLKAVTAVETGTRYLRALSSIAGPATDPGPSPT